MPKKAQITVDASDGNLICHYSNSMVNRVFKARFSDWGCARDVTKGKAFVNAQRMLVDKFQEEKSTAGLEQHKRPREKALKRNRKGRFRFLQKHSKSKK